MRQEVEKVLDEIRPFLRSDGGGVELMEVGGDGTVKVKLTGACFGCRMSTITLKNGIERMLKQEIPAVKQVLAV